MKIWELQQLLARASAELGAEAEVYFWEDPWKEMKLRDYPSDYPIHGLRNVTCSGSVELGLNLEFRENKIL